MDLAQCSEAEAAVLADGAESETACIIGDQEAQKSTSRDAHPVPRSFCGRFARPLKVAAVVAAVFTLGAAAVASLQARRPGHRPNEEAKAQLRFAESLMKGRGEASADALQYLTSLYGVTGPHGGLAKPRFLEEPGKDPALTAQCVVDVTQSTAYLGQAIVFLYKASSSGQGGRCPDETPGGCAVSIAGYITSLAWVASYISILSTSCTQTLNAKAACAADWSAVVADFGELASCGAAAASDCNFGPKPTPLERVHGLRDKLAELKGSHAEAKEVSQERQARGPRTRTADSQVLTKRTREVHVKGDAEEVSQEDQAHETHMRAVETEVLTKRDRGGYPIWAAQGPKDGPKVFGRRMAESEWQLGSFLRGVKNATEERRQAKLDRGFDIAQCTFDVVQVASYIVRAAVQIDGASEHCDDKKACMIDVTNIISTFAWLSQFTSLSVADCAVDGSQHALCAADISDLVAASVNLVAVGGAVTVDCASQVDTKEEEDIRLAAV